MSLYVKFHGYDNGTVVIKQNVLFLRDVQAEVFKSEVI